MHEIVDVMELAVPALAGTIDAKGGVLVAALRQVLDPVAEGLGLAPCRHDMFAAKVLSWENRDRRIAVSVHAGRAESNNEVLLAVLGAAAHFDVDWLVAVLPSRYKQGHTFEKVVAQLGALSRAGGVRMDLVGVTLVGF